MSVYSLINTQTKDISTMHYQDTIFTIYHSFLISSALTHGILNNYDEQPSKAA
jgi:hypothetical protein